MKTNAVHAVTGKSTANATPGQADIRYLIKAAREGVIEPEEAADALLAVHGALGKEQGIYTDLQLSRKMRREAQRLPTIDESAISEDTVDYLTHLQIEELTDLADLSPMQDVCYRLHCDGMSGREVARVLGLSAQAVSHHLHEARVRVKRICREGRYAGWYQVYLSEVNRTGAWRR